MGKPVRDVAHVRRDDDGVEDRRRRLLGRRELQSRRQPSGPSVLNVLFDNNGHCADGGTIGGGQGFAPGPYQVQSDGSFNGSKTFMFSNGDVEVTTISGKFTSDGSAGGTANVSSTFGRRS